MIILARPIDIMKTDRLISILSTRRFLNIKKRDGFIISISR